MRGLVPIIVYICSSVSCHALSTREVAGQSTCLPMTSKEVMLHSYLVCRANELLRRWK